MLSDDDLEGFRRALTDRLDELDRLDASSADSRKPVELDQSSVGRLSRMDAMQQQAMALAIAGRRDVERRRLKAALARLDIDEFGMCLRCGEEIDRERLAFDPAIAQCGDCMKGGG